jgi:5-methylcytosine-specific restriction endonuclease McrA
MIITTPGVQGSSLSACPNRHPASSFALRGAIQMNSDSYYAYLRATEHLTHAQRRSKRLAEARERGTHSKLEWEILLSVFGKCVICNTPYEYLNGGRPTKDHIIPIYWEGCDCIGNLQPLCKNCNSGKANFFDYRNIASPGWFGRYRLLMSEVLRGR